MRVFGVATLLVLVSMLSGCATVMNGGGTSEVQLVSTPPGASYEIRDVRGRVVGSGVTPSRAALRDGYGWGSRGRYQVLFRKDGYSDIQKEMIARRNGWYWFNILVGGPIGYLFVDPFTGAMYKVPPQFSSELQPLAQPVPLRPIATTASEFSTTPPALSRDQQLRELQQQSPSYEEYQRRYREIMGQ